MRVSGSPGSCGICGACYHTMRGRPQCNTQRQKSRLAADPSDFFLTNLVLGGITCPAGPFPAGRLRCTNPHAGLSCPLLTPRMLTISCRDGPCSRHAGQALCSGPFGSFAPPRRLATPDSIAVPRMPCSANKDGCVHACGRARAFRRPSNFARLPAHKIKLTEPIGPSSCASRIARRSAIFSAPPIRRSL
jgi:hypothetical protein